MPPVLFDLDVVDHRVRRSHTHRSDPTADRAAAGNAPRRTRLQPRDSPARPAGPRVNGRPTVRGDCNRTDIHADGRAGSRNTQLATMDGRTGLIPVPPPPE